MVLPVLSSAGCFGEFWNMEFIKMKDIVKVMSKADRFGQPVPFDLTFVTCDEKRGTGGEKITLKDAICIGGPSTRKMIRDPHHDTNFTRNIRAREGDKIITVSILLVTRFNGMIKSI